MDLISGTLAKEVSLNDLRATPGGTRWGEWLLRSLCALLCVQEPVGTSVS